MARGMTEAHRPSPGAPPPRATLSQQLTEQQFQAQVMELLQVTGWLAHHHYDARRSAPGLPDVIATHSAHGLLFAELKSKSGRVTVDQQRWLEALHQTAAHLEGLTAHSRHNGGRGSASLVTCDGRRYECPHCGGEVTWPICCGSFCPRCGLPETRSRDERMRAYSHLCIDCQLEVHSTPRSERLALILKQREQGWTNEDIGIYWDLSRARVGQLLRPFGVSGRTGRGKRGTLIKVPMSGSFS